MKRLLISFILLFSFFSSQAQSCEDLIKHVKSQGYGTTYSSPLSDAISKVTFYRVSENYHTYYFAVVCFKRKYSYNCDEYIYQVGSSSQTNYSINYLESAGSAFWKYIQPYHKNLKCSPSFE